MSDDTASARLAHLPPVGLAAKRLSDGLATFVDALLGREFGLLRRHWQLLRWTHERGDAQVEEFVAEAATFYTETEARQVIDDLVGRGWVLRDGSRLELTATGRSGFEAMARAQETTWDVVLEGIGEDRYVATVETMTAMADNLARSIQTRPAHG